MVIGSGPAALGVTHGLIARGIKPVVVDCGLTADSEHTLGHPGVGSLPDKLHFGSDHPYRTPEALSHTYASSAGARASFALGGLSTVWGSALMPYGPQEMRGWPISPAELAPHMEALADVVPVSASDSDALAWVYPLPMQPIGILPAPTSMQRIADRFARSAPRGVSGGRARLAVNPGPGPSGCTMCGECITGCTFDSIFDAGRVVNRLAAAGRIEYRSGLVVMRLIPKHDGVEVNVANVDGSRCESIWARRVFLAAGVIGTAGIIMRSSGGAIRRVHALDSQYFMVPLVRVAAEPLDAQRVALAQLFVEVRDRKRNGDLAHFQIYAPNRLMQDMVGERLRVAPRRLTRKLTSHLLGVQGFLHSRWSGRLEVASDGDGVRVSGVSSPASRPAALAALSGLRRAWRQLGGLPLSPGLIMAEPGRSFHIGGTFPMSTAPTSREVDTLGRMAELPGVHLVDASVFPTIPACTITLPAMANARRIAAAVSR